MANDPDFHFSGFSLWIDGRQFAQAEDYWDANWLMVRARMEATGARIECHGPIMMTADIQRLREQLIAMDTTLAGEAALSPIEPEIDLSFKMQKMGTLEAIIEITPDHMTQSHRFIVEADQSYLSGLISYCDNVLSRFPVINEHLR
jgi:hypothetical protein